MFAYCWERWVHVPRTAEAVLQMWTECRAQDNSRQVSGNFHKREKFEYEIHPRGWITGRTAQTLESHHTHTRLLPGILMTSLMMSNITSRSREAKNKNLAIVLDENTSREVWLAVMIDALSSNMIPRQLCVSVRTCVCASSMTLTPVTPVCRDKPPGWGSAGRQTSCPYSPLFQLDPEIHVFCLYFILMAHFSWF